MSLGKANIPNTNSNSSRLSFSEEIIPEQFIPKRLKSAPQSADPSPGNSPTSPPVYPLCLKNRRYSSSSSEFPDTSFPDQDLPQKPPDRNRIFSPIPRANKSGRPALFNFESNRSYAINDVNTQDQDIILPEEEADEHPTFQNDTSFVLPLLRNPPSNVSAFSTTSNNNPRKIPHFSLRTKNNQSPYPKKQLQPIDSNHSESMPPYAPQRRVISRRFSTPQLSGSSKKTISNSSKSATQNSSSYSEPPSPREKTPPLIPQKGRMSVLSTWANGGDSDRLMGSDRPTLTEHFSQSLSRAKNYWADVQEPYFIAQGKSPPPPERSASPSPSLPPPLPPVEDKKEKRIFKPFPKVKKDNIKKNKKEENKFIRLVKQEVNDIVGKNISENKKKNSNSMNIMLKEDFLEIINKYKYFLNIIHKHLCNKKDRYKLYLKNTSAKNLIKKREHLNTIELLESYVSLVTEHAEKQPQNKIAHMKKMYKRNEKIIEEIETLEEERSNLKKAIRTLDEALEGLAENRRFDINRCIISLKKELQNENSVDKDKNLQNVVKIINGILNEKTGNIEAKRVEYIYELRRCDQNILDIRALLEKYGLKGQFHGALHTKKSHTKSRGSLDLSLEPSLEFRPTYRQQTTEPQPLLHPYVSSLGLDDMLKTSSSSSQRSSQPTPDGVSNQHSGSRSIVTMTPTTQSESKDSSSRGAPELRQFQTEPPSTRKIIETLESGGKEDAAPERLLNIHSAFPDNRRETELSSSYESDSEQKRFELNLEDTLSYSQEKNSSRKNILKKARSDRTSIEWNIYSNSHISGTVIKHSNRTAQDSCIPTCIDESHTRRHIQKAPTLKTEIISLTPIPTNNRHIDDTILLHHRREKEEKSDHPLKSRQRNDRRTGYDTDVSERESEMGDFNIISYNPSIWGGDSDGNENEIGYESGSTHL